MQSEVTDPFNDWFLSLPEGRRKVLREDKWGLADAAFKAGLEAALSTDADPVTMDDEDRTPMPAGFDDAIWRRADEVHHAMALVARDQECVKIIYAALSTHNEEPVKTAPAVAVKDLEWKTRGKDEADFYVDTVVGQYVAADIWGEAKALLRRVEKGQDHDEEIGVCESVSAAKAAAQADYEARILSALSAQVQDVAEYEYRLITAEGREYARLNATTDQEAHEINDKNFDGRLTVERRVVPKWEITASPASKHGDAE